MADFLAAGGHFFSASAVHDGNRFRAETERGTRRVHSDVTRSDYRNASAFLDGGNCVFAVRAHKIYAGEKLVSREHAVKVFARDPHKHRKSRARPDKHRVVFGEKFGNGDRFADNRVRNEFYALLGDFIHFFSDERLWKAEFGDSVNEYAARLVKGFVNGNFHARSGELRRAGKPARTAAHYRDAFADAFRRGVFCGNGQHIIAHEPFHAAYAYRAVDTGANAHFFALVFLRTDPAANGRERVGRFDDFARLFDFSFAYFRQKFGNTHADGTAFHARRGSATKTARRLVAGKVKVESDSHFVEVMRADGGILFGYKISRFFLDCHDYLFSPVSWQRCCFSCSRYAPRRFIASAQSTSCPSNSGPSTHA